MNMLTRQPASAQGCDIVGQARLVERHVKAALGRPLFALFRHKADGMRTVTQRKRLHFRRGGTFEVQRDRDRRHQRLDVASRMWRRSSRRWAVIPSAPAASASRAARKGSGQACRAHSARSRHGRC
jgi:hypothetical protein